MTEMQAVVYEELKNNCGGLCLTEPGKCECFGAMSKERQDELGIDDYEDDDAFYTAEECPHYDVQGYNGRQLKIIDEKYNADMANFIYNHNAKGKTLQPGYTKDEIVKELTDHMNDGVDPNSLGFSFSINSVQCFNEEDSVNEKTLEYVYILHSDHGTKIGRSVDPHTRSRTIGTKTPFKITRTEIFHVKNMSKAEKGLHKHFKQYRLNGEWFNLDDSQIQEARDIIEKEYGEIKEALVPLFERKEIGKKE